MQQNTSQIRDIFYRELPINVTPKLATVVIHFVNAYESRNTHPEAFNSPYLGLHPCYFLTKDRDDFFALFDYTEATVKSLISTSPSHNSTMFGVSMRSLLDPITKSLQQLFQTTLRGAHNLTNAEVRNSIKEITSINTNFKVASDPFNLFSIYAAHCFFASDLPEKLRYEAALKCLLLLEYKFFTSLVNHRFKYRPDEESMRALFEGLSSKFDIKQYGTWKEVLEARAHSFLKKEGIHYETLQKFDNDFRILYVVTDLQTRIRNQINIFTEEFMKIKESRDKIGSYTLAGSDIDGEKVIVDLSNSYDIMISGVYHAALSVPQFIDDMVIRIVTSFFTGINQTKMKSVLISFSEWATKQARSGQQMKIGVENGEPIDIGAQVLITSIIQKTYRYFVITNTNIKNVSSIVKSTKDVYSSSRILDEGILHVRRSVSYLLTKIQDSQREATLTSLRTAFIMYVILLSFKYLKK